MNNNIEKKIEELDNISEWVDKITRITEIKEEITTQKEKITEYIDMINQEEYKKNKKMKNMSLDELLKLFNETEELETKMKIYNTIQAIIIELKSELFDE
jgi:hypothetical protein